MGFATNQVNLTKLESFSVKNTFDQANFYLDLEGHLEQPGVKKALEELGFHTETLDILGVYEASPIAKIVHKISILLLWYLNLSWYNHIEVGIRWMFHKPGQVWKEAAVVKIIQVVACSIKMTNKILALKYRPQNFNDLIGQEVMTQTILNAIN